MSSDKLIEIPKSQWLGLRDLYLINWPINMIGYYTIDNYIQWVHRQPTIKQLVVYSLNGDWSDGTFVVLDYHQMIVNTLNESNERLTILLSLLDWSHGFLIYTLRKRHHSAVLEVAATKNLKTLFDNETDFYYMRREECLNLDVRVPNGITVGNLNLEQVSIADSVWPQRGPRSLRYLQRLAEFNANVCLTTNPDDKLVAWCFRLPSGPLAALQVADDYKRKGFGTLTLKLIALKLAKIGHDVCGCVVQENIASHEMFKKCGFKVIDKVFFVGIEDTKTLEFEK